MSTPWDTVRSALRAELGALYDIWIQPIRLLDITDTTVRLEVPNAIFRDWVRDHYSRRIGDGFRAALAAPQLQVHFEIAGESAPAVLPPPVGAAPPRPQRAAARGLGTPAVHVPPVPAAVRRSPPPLPPSIQAPRPAAPRPAAPPVAGGGAVLGVAPSKRFDTFVVGSCNQFAHAAAEAVAGSPGSASYNPLFIYGGTGMGKTHLMHAIGNRVRRGDPSARILYVTAEQFTNEMIDALRFRDMHGFREKYRHNVTLLLMDDVQFLSGKDRTQEELFHTFEWLRERGHQIVFTADVLPREIHGFAPRLRTRFESGMLADMQAPDAETVEAIVQRKAAERGLELGAEVARYLGGKLRGSIREVEGVLNRLLALSSMLGGRPDLDFVRSHLGRSLGETKAAPEPKAILKLVAAYYDVDPKDVLGKRRQRSLVLPRHVCMYLCRHHTERSFPELGRFFQRDHTTVQHGVKKIESRLAKGELDLRRAVRHLEQSLG